MFPLSLIAAGVLFSPLSGQTTKPAVDLSTPERTVTTFLDAANRNDFPNMRRRTLARGGSTKPAEFFANGGAKFTFTKVKPVLKQRSGDAATVVVSYKVQAGSTTSTAQETISLTKQADGWKIDYLASMAASSTRAKPEQGLQGVVSMLAAFAEGNEYQLKAFTEARDRARSIWCLSNVKQLGLAALMYVADYEDVFPPAVKWESAVEPYYKNRAVLACPLDKRGSVSYSMNPALSRAIVTQVLFPADTVLFYDGKDGKFNFRHQGKAAVTFADGHAELIDPARAATVRWNLESSPSGAGSQTKPGR